MRAALIFNPVAGGPSSPSVEELTGRLAGRCALTVFETSPERDADACARDALTAGAAIVIAAGGDGTTSMVARELAGRDVLLGVLPCGTSNSVADALDIPSDMDAACENLFAGRPRWIDLARCNDSTMLLMCSIGFHAETVTSASRKQKNRWGVFAYIAEGLKHLLDTEPFDVELETEAHLIRCRATSVAVANLAPPKTVIAQGPAFIRPDDGLLDVTVVAASGLVASVAAGLHLFRTATQHEPAAHDRIGYLACSRIRVRTPDPMRVLVDGEPMGETPVELSCLPRSLRILTPTPAPTEPPAPEADLSRLPDVEIAKA